jgi:RNA polymerase-binding transcription factor DksA
MAKSKAKPAKRTSAKKTVKSVKKAAAKKVTRPVKKTAVKKTAAKPKRASVPTKRSAAKPTTKKKTLTTKKTPPPVKLTANDNEVIANAKVRYGQRDLDAFRKVILEQRDEAKEEFDIISQQLLDTSGEYDGENQSFALHTAEQGSDAMEREKQYLQAQRTSDYIKKLDEALERIDRGTYGICVVCGKLIEKPRLYAVPITQKHVVCKNKTNVKRASGETASVATLDDVMD